LDNRRSPGVQEEKPAPRPLLMERALAEPGNSGAASALVPPSTHMRRERLKIKESITTTPCPVDRKMRQDFPVIGQKGSFASYLARYVGDSQPPGSSRSQHTEAKSLQDYRQELRPRRESLAPVRVSRRRTEARREAERQVPEHIQTAIRKAAHKHQLPAELIAAVIRVESNFDPKAVSSEGAAGLMQLMPSTARELGVRNRYDIRENIDGGTRYLKEMLERFDGNLELALAAYNAGPGAVERHQGIPPYRETQRYVKKVLAYS
jgi:soluble lytic murein transglycosylase-like protein